MKTIIKKMIIFDAPRKDENCKSNVNRMICGAIVFDNPVGANTPTMAVNLTAKELDMLCNDLGIKGTDASGNYVSRGISAWQTLKGFVNRFDNARADVEVEERAKGDTYTNALGEEVAYDKDSTSVRVTMIRFDAGVSDRLIKAEQSWSKPVTGGINIDEIMSNAGKAFGTNNLVE